MFYKIILLLLFSFTFSNDRSIIFNAPPSTLVSGFDLFSNENISNSVADRFYIYNDYILEGFSLWMKSDINSTITVKLFSDNFNSPGDLIYEWPLNLSASDFFAEIYTPTVSFCINLTSNSYYWLSVETPDSVANISWQHSILNSYYSTSDNGIDWSESIYGPVGATSIRGEQIFTFSQGYPDGDINFDFYTDVLDVVIGVGFVLGNEQLDTDQILALDLNFDSYIDILDIVILVELVLEDPTMMPDFSLEDINPNSENFGQNIGPSFYNGVVSGYYFGKAG